MFSRKFALVCALATGLMGPGMAVAASPANGAPCLLSEYQVTSVAPYRTEEHVGKASFPALRGATVSVAAQPGLTAEWLQLRLEHHLEEMKNADMPSCALDLNRVRVEVSSVGDGFAVRLITNDRAEAAEVLRRAQLLVGARG
ncbi:MAG TPA: hypothetical protein VG963_08220 [Polyangiaceae bacterium]|nr:hypothetical protein [Polyangiaceae bacterium]